MNRRDGSSFQHVLGVVADGMGMECGEGEREFL